MTHWAAHSFPASIFPLEMLLAVTRQDTDTVRHAAQVTATPLSWL